MRKLVLIRVLWAVPILLGVSIIAFFLVRALPGDYAQVQAGMTGEVSAETLDSVRRSLGLDRPIWQQYLAWLGDAVRGDLGTSFARGTSVRVEIVERVGVTLELTIIAAVMAVLLGVTTGLLSARLRGGAEWVVRTLNVLGAAVPNFVIATLIVLLVGLYVPSIPIFGYQAFSVDPGANIRSLLLPALALAMSMAVTISENTRASVLEVENMDYVRVARAKGMAPGVILRRYLLRNAMTPVLTVTGVQVAAIMGGSIIIETIFGIPGLGQLLFSAVNSRDYPVLQAVVLIVAAIVVLVNTIVDIGYAKVDARVRDE